MRRSGNVRSICAAILVASASRTATAQDVQYHTTTKIDMGTAMNVMLKMAHAQELTETSYIKGKKMRTDSDKQSTIYDMDGGRFIIINHNDKTYVSAPIAQMAAA